jgi:hypothetical protein
MGLGVYTMRTKTLLISGSWLLLLGFWVCFFLPPERNGYGLLYALFIQVYIALGMVYYGFGLCFAAWIGKLRLRFGILVTFCPAVFWLGSEMESPLCFVFFVVPSVAVLWGGLCELDRTPEGKEHEEGKEKRKEEKSGKEHAARFSRVEKKTGRSSFFEGKNRNSLT